MKFNIKKNGIYSFAFATAVSLTSCVKDLDVTPIDPNLDTPENVLTSTEAYNQMLAKCYSGLSVSSPDGDSGRSMVVSVSICVLSTTCRSCLPMRPLSVGTTRP